MIQILLSTYNGEKYLTEQFDSILAQTNDKWQIVVRDDASTDATRSIIDRYAARYPSKIVVSISSGQHLGIIRSFETLLKESRAEYVMFADQDDVWMPDKIERTLHLMQSKEHAAQRKVPIVVHTDMKVVDSELNVISESFWRATNIHPEILDRRAVFLGFCNSATGCTMMLNRRAVELSLPFPDNCAMHDAHVAMKAVQHGELAHLSEPTMLYRQHGFNALGTTEYSFSVCNKLRNVKTVYRKIKEARVVYPDVYKNDFVLWTAKLHYFFILHCQ